MEKSEIESSAIILGSMAAIVITIVVIVFVIIQVRVIYSLRSINKRLIDQRDNDLKRMQDEINEIRSEIGLSIEGKSPENP